MASGTISLVVVLWLECGFPVLLDRFVIEAHPPAKADAIVCIGGGIGAHVLPTADHPRNLLRLNAAGEAAVRELAAITVYSLRGED